MTFDAARGELLVADGNRGLVTSNPRVLGAARPVARYAATGATTSVEWLGEAHGAEMDGIEDAATRLAVERDLAARRTGDVAISDGSFLYRLRVPSLRGGEPEPAERVAWLPGIERIARTGNASCALAVLTADTLACFQEVDDHFVATRVVPLTKYGCGHEPLLDDDQPPHAEDNTLPDDDRHLPWTSPPSSMPAPTLLPEVAPSSVGGPAPPAVSRRGGGLGLTIVFVVALYFIARRRRRETAPRYTVLSQDEVDDECDSHLARAKQRTKGSYEEVSQLDDDEEETHDRRPIAGGRRAATRHHRGRGRLADEVVPPDDADAPPS